MPSILHSLKTKGFKGTIFRAAGLIDRYGFTSHKMERNILSLIKILDKYDAVATLPVTAKTLERNSWFMKDIPNQGIELAIHGYTHIDYSKVSAMEQSRSIKKSIEIFNMSGIKPSGFRGPYLQANDDTLNALKENNLLYDSSPAIDWNIISEDHIGKNIGSYNLALKLYRPLNAETNFLPKSINGLIRIPVSLPDDEILIDRLKIRNKEILTKIWLNVMEKAQRKSGVFVLQLHPERIRFTISSLERLLIEAGKRDMWVTSMKDLAIYWAKNNKFEEGQSAFCVTGDVDIMSLWDY